MAQRLSADNSRSPAARAMDEAIELAKRYGDRDSAHFVNGVLDEVARRLELKNKGEDRFPPKHD